MAGTITRADLEAFRSANTGRSGLEVRRLINTDKAFRAEIERLYVGVYHIPLNSACTECWVDAFVLLMRDDVDAMCERSKRLFELKAGALLRDVIDWRKELNTTHHNLTDDLALYHLATHPAYITQFSKAPDNWRELAAAAYNADGTPVKRAEMPVKRAETPADAPGSAEVTNPPSDAENALKSAKKAVSNAKGALTRSRNRGDAAAVARAEAALAQAQAALDALQQ